VRLDQTQYVRRILWLVAALDRRPMTRKELASRWDVTPRAVNHLLGSARAMFKVRIEHVPHTGYALRDPGVLNVRALAGRRAA
jgi:DNA-binding transcriptional regulator LsrR (DeoR family)